jgi:ribosomal protein S18 acetylase RimI-like enzyme
MLNPVLSDADIADVVSLAKEIWPKHYTAIIGAAQVAYMLERFQSPGAISKQIGEGAKYFLIMDNGKVVGYCSVQPKAGEGALFLSKLYILSSCRGRGLGKRAILVLEQMARQEKLSKISLTVSKKNYASITAYEHCGFKKAGDIVIDIGKGFVMDDYIYEKEINL